MSEVRDQLRRALWPRYELGPELGRGGTAAVYLARDTQLRRDVAVKVLLPDPGLSDTNSRESRARFVREAQTIAGLAHPNVIPIFDVGEAADLVWFVMAFVSGESLRVRVERDGPLPLRLVIRYLQEAAQGLAYAHVHGVVHRDVKPDNLLLDTTDQRIMVGDFGIAKVLRDPQAEIGEENQFLGTFRYMSPEQWMNQATVDHRTDIFSLGLVGYFLLTGRDAVQADSLLDIYRFHEEGDAVRLGDLGRRVPEALRELLSRCLAANPADRFSSMEEIDRALKELSAERMSIPAPVRSLFRETERAFIATTIGVMALGFVGFRKVPPAFLLLTLGLTLVQGLLSISQARSRRITWAQIRRALCLERRRRIEEFSDEKAPTDWLAAALHVAIFVGAFVLGGELTNTKPGDGSWANMSIFLAGAVGGLMAVRLFGVRSGIRIDSPLLGRPWVAGVLFTLPLLMAGYSLYLSYQLRQPMPYQEAGLAIVVSFMAWTIRMTEPPRADTTEDMTTNWWIPGWLDWLGSWLFAHISIRKWRLVIYRDRPLQFQGERDLAEARRLLRRVEKAAGKRLGGARLVHRRVLEVSRKVVYVTSDTVENLRPLVLRIMQLNEGLLLAHGSDASLGLEEQRERIERELQPLHDRITHCLEQLGLLARHLESDDVPGLSRSLSALDAWLERPGGSTPRPLT